MQTIFISVHDNMSEFMQSMRRTGSRIIVAKGGFSEFGDQGWNVSFLPGPGWF